MNYISLEFVLFFFVVVLVFYLLPGRAKKYWLLVSSWAFYLTFTLSFGSYLLGITVYSWLMGLLVQKTRTISLSQKRVVLALGIIGTFAVLAVIKYGNFVFRNVGIVLSHLELAYRLPVMELIQPIGLSFFSFQAVGYLIDVYRGKRDAEENPANYALFLSFFPIIMSGPIERSTNLLQQIDEIETIRLDTSKIRHGLLTMLYGCFLKMVIADRLNLLVNTVFANYDQFGGCLLAVAVVAFGIQLYCDFAGISTIALGAGEALGFSLIDNFAFPYFSQSINEFWRRWHISLSSWFRDYLYIPLGGNRKGALRKYINLMIVFLVSGLWHGAGWHYIVWGGINGLYLVMSGILKPVRKKITTLCHIDPDNAGNHFIKMLFTFGIVNFAWLFFRAASLTDAWHILKKIFLQFSPWQLVDGSLLTMGLDGAELGVLVAALLVLMLVSAFGYHGIDWRSKLMEQGFAFRCIMYVICVATVLLFGIYGPAYSASSFIYVDF